MCVCARGEAKPEGAGAAAGSAEDSSTTAAPACNCSSCSKGTKDGRVCMAVECSADNEAKDLGITTKQMQSDGWTGERVDALGLLFDAIVVKRKAGEGMLALFQDPNRVETPAAARAWAVRHCPGETFGCCGSGKCKRCREGSRKQHRALQELDQATLDWVLERLPPRHQEIAQDIDLESAVQEAALNRR